MDVNDSISLGSSHSLEWGDATWDATDFSIRNRYNSATGRFNKAGSSEVPWEDFKVMIIESIKRKHLTDADLATILREIANRL